MIIFFIYIIKINNKCNCSASKITYLVKQLELLSYILKYKFQLYDFCERLKNTYWMPYPTITTTTTNK
jgi:hypothetical protein